MKELLTPFTNWRTHVLAILGIIALVLITSETNDDTSLLVLVAFKAIGFALVYAIYRLFTYWAAKGKIDELTRLAKEED